MPNAFADAPLQLEVDDFERLVDALLDDTITVQEHQRLDQLLLHSVTARRLYLQLIQVHCDLSGHWCCDHGEQ